MRDARGDFFKMTTRKVTAKTYEFYADETSKTLALSILKANVKEAAALKQPAWFCFTAPFSAYARGWGGWGNLPGGFIGATTINTWINTGN